MTPLKKHHITVETGLASKPENTEYFHERKLSALCVSAVKLVLFQQRYHVCRTPQSMKIGLFSRQSSVSICGKRAKEIGIMTDEITVQELMNRMPKAFKPEMAAGVDAVIQYHLTGNEGGDWIIEVQNGSIDVKPGVHPSPKVTLTADAQDYKDVIMGRSNAMQAFMQGKLKLAGDLGLAMKLPNMFKM
jgi:putative sterol carrier protein